MRTVAFDIGTHSLGTCVRDTELGDNIKDQLVYFSVDSFNSGIGNGKSGEYSYAAERSKARRARNLNERRRYRNWATLKLLIENNMCPLTMDELKSWSTYDKAKGLFRKYPVDAIKFEQWIRLDFDHDGKPEYSSPYQLRRELMTRQFDFSQEIERHKLGRAMYHISQRRGFKSSKGETLKELEAQNSEKEDIDISGENSLIELKKSEEKKSGILTQYMQDNNLPTIGCAFAHLEDRGVRIRNSIYQAVRSQYKDEIIQIFNYQKNLINETTLLNRLISEKKGEGTIFYKRPLKSQKGLVGKCTLEPNKTRCPISHPKFEEFRAWCFINNIRYKTDPTENWKELSIEDKTALYHDIFISKVRQDFSFRDIRKWIETRLGITLICEEDVRTINYKDNLTVSGCPITSRLAKMLGDNWEAYEQIGKKERYSHSKNPTKHITKYTSEDIWHICYFSEEESDIMLFAEDKLGWTDDRCNQLLRLWNDIREGYAMLSKKALVNINYFLRKGLKYSDAVLLAKLPDIIGHERWNKEEELQKIAIDALSKTKQEEEKQKNICNITNRLIANYKSLGVETGCFAYKDYEYTLTSDDHNDIQNAVIQHFGENTWNKKNDEEKQYYITEVTQLYQCFFHDKKREYIRSNRITEKIVERFNDIYGKHNFDKLYHHSNLSPYPTISSNNSQLLGTPNIGAIKNPVALRTLHIIRKKVNALILNGIIDPETTRVVIETTRNFNDANMRWAINKYQKNREEEHKEIKNIIREFNSGIEISNTDINKAISLFEQNANYDSIYNTKGKIKDITKYRLWKEQGGVCMYTGRPINLTNLFNENIFQIEHTIPRSISFDNSLANLTICESHYNNVIKNNKFPTELPNYNNDEEIKGIRYSAIEPRLNTWKQIVTRLQSNVSAWKARARKAIDKNRKDHCIRQMHLWQMELDYWQTKLLHFTQTEVTDGFRNRQLVDTGILTKHTTIYLKSLFRTVDVQKGEVTSTFRNIFGLPEKDRSKLSHHAIDAFVLTMIPVPAKRERMLKLFFQKEETYGQEREFYINELEREIRDCHINGNIGKIISFIESNILVNHHSSDKTLVPAKKTIRKRGKVVIFKHNDGSLHSHVSTGDCIRGSLHQESYYGAIKYPITENGIPITENGKFIYDESDPLIVMRIPIEKIKKEDIDKIIIDPHVRKSIQTILERRMAEGMAYDKAIKGEFWMLNKEGEEIRVDKKGHRLSPIRHVRCKVKAGRGYMTYNSSLPIRTHTCISTKNLTHLEDRTHKEKIYAQNNDNYLCLLYEGIKKNKVVRKSRIINYYEIALLRQEKTNDGNYIIKNLTDLLREPYFNRIEEKGIVYNLSCIIKYGTRMIKWEKNPEELFNLSTQELSKRLYVVKKFNSVGSDRLYLKLHIDGHVDENIKDFGISKLDFLIENRDFYVDDLGNIHFYNLQ